MEWTAVGFATPEYEGFTAPWSDMIEKLGGTPVIMRVKSTGHTARNTGLKPGTIEHAWRKVKTPWFLYLDIDTMIRSAPKVPEGDWDVGVSDNLVLEHVNRISASAIIFKKTRGSMRFLQGWARFCAKAPGKDHGPLTRLLKHLPPGVKVVDVTSGIDWVHNGLVREPERVLSAPVLPLDSNKSSVWYVVPSIRPAAEAMRALRKWMERGYRVAVQRDPRVPELPVDLCVHRAYSGYADAVNHLVAQVLQRDPSAEWIVTGGDDVYPDPEHDPAQIAAECTEHFQGTMGIMQPTGDRHLVEKDGSCSSERACVSPWMGREWCQWCNGGVGPLNPAYFHCFVDGELREVALARLQLWERPDLSQYHAWWAREKKARPTHLNPKRIRWEKDKKIYEQRKAMGFPSGDKPQQPVYVGFYTPGAYEAESRILFESLDALGLQHDFVNIGEVGSWQEITHRKAFIVRDALIKHTGRPVVYLDVDCLVLQPPRLFDTLSCDVAASVFAGCELLSGTVYFGNTLMSRRVVETWIELNKQHPEKLPNGQDAWDQRTLKMAIAAHQTCRFIELPASYTYMIGLSQTRYPGVNPIILHTRGSLKHNPEHV